MIPTILFNYEQTRFCKRCPHNSKRYHNMGATHSNEWP